MNRLNCKIQESQPIDTFLKVNNQDIITYESAHMITGDVEGINVLGGSYPFHIANIPCHVSFVENFRLLENDDQLYFLDRFDLINLEKIPQKCLEKYIDELQKDAYDYCVTEKYKENSFMLLHRFTTEYNRREDFEDYLRKIDNCPTQQKIRQMELMNDIPKLLRSYGFWLRDDLMLAFKIDGEARGYLAAKRGNKTYMESMNTKIRKLEENMPTVKIFDANTKDRKSKYTSVINVTMTYAQRKISKFDAWDKVSDDINLYVAKIRKEYGTVRIFRSYESHKSGYPHVNIIMIFEDHHFRTFYQKYKKPKPKQKRKGAWRITEKTIVEDFWEHGYSDVVAVSSIEGVMDSPEEYTPNSFPLMHAVKYITKDYSKYKSDEESKTGFMQMSILWAMRKQSFSFSKSRDGKNLFLQSLAGVAGRLDWTIKPNSNPDLEKDLENATKADFLGIIHYFEVELKAKWKPPDDICYNLPDKVVCLLRGWDPKELGDNTVKWKMDYESAIEHNRQNQEELYNRFMEEENINVGGEIDEKKSVRKVFV
ncbi:MAG: hypothetical protein KAJ18_11495 [Candidatus Omnitrophica bacterium]|nr:hypothetical protein [Candidatus Omnitrophota bacterium]